MTRAVVIFLGLLALAVFIFVCINNNAPAIQNDIQTRTSTILSNDSSTKWATVRADGRNIILTGIAPTEAKRQQASDIASSVDGVLNVDNQITVAYTAPAITSSSTSPDSQNSPYESEFSRSASGIVLSGSVPNQEQRKKLLRLAREKFGDGHVTDFLIVKPDAPKDWYQTASSAIKNLVLLRDGAVAITDKQINIIGQVIDDTAKHKIENNLKNELPDQITFNLNLDPPPELKAKKDESAIPQAIQSSSCGKQFNKLVSPKIVNFSTDSTSIESQANIVIEQLIKYSEMCPNSIIEVGGHSDSRGNEAHNYLLSKQRARTIVNSLIKSGIRKDRLVVEGYGESNPLADNSTEKGQALNRRIEFKYLREGD
jgi:OOP family OmpA-OmpF porin